jgi:hypothetical protein
MGLQFPRIWQGMEGSTEALHSGITAAQISSPSRSYSKSDQPFFAQNHRRQSGQTCRLFETVSSLNPVFLDV